MARLRVIENPIIILLLLSDCLLNARPLPCDLEIVVVGFGGLGMDANPQEASANSFNVWRETLLPVRDSDDELRLDGRI